MPFIQRINGEIAGRFANPQPGYAEEFLADDAPELLAHLASLAETPADRRRHAYAAESDALVIRALRLQLAGDPGFEAAKTEALAKVAEIKAANPDKEA